jgi:uncharacterized protein (DUF111 family)
MHGKDHPSVKRKTSPFGLPDGARRVLYLDCFSGISGDMFLGLSVDLGVSLATLKRQLARLPLKGYSLSSRRVARSGLWGTQVEVRTSPGRGESHPHAHGERHRGITEIRKIVNAGGLPERARSRALRAFETLVDAEARVHRVPAREIHPNWSGPWLPAASAASRKSAS